jgi:hypothetical protein
MVTNVKYCNIRKNPGDIERFSDMKNTLDNLTPRVNAIAKDLLRVVADVHDFGYSESGTTVNGLYIHVTRGDKKLVVTMSEASRAHTIQ